MLSITSQLQIKTRRCHYTPTRVASIQNADTTRCRRGCVATETRIHCWWECKTVKWLWKSVRSFLTKLIILLPDGPITMLLGIYPSEFRTYIGTKTYPGTLRAVSVTIAQTWTQSRYPAGGACTNTLRHIQTVQHWPAVKGNEPQAMRRRQGTWDVQAWVNEARLRKRRPRCRGGKRTSLHLLGS